MDRAATQRNPAGRSMGPPRRIRRVVASPRRLRRQRRRVRERHELRRERRMGARRREWSRPGAELGRAFSPSAASTDASSCLGRVLGFSNSTHRRARREQPPEPVVPIWHRRSLGARRSRRTAPARRFRAKRNELRDIDARHLHTPLLARCRARSDGRFDGRCDVDVPAERRTRGGCRPRVERASSESRRARRNGDRRGRVPGRGSS